MDIRQYLRFYTVGRKENLATGEIESIFDIDYHSLQKQGIRLLMYDADDTLSGDAQPFHQHVLDLLSVLSRDFHIGILSNCGQDRNKNIEEMLDGIPSYVEPSSRKPHTHGYEQVMSHFNVDPHETAMIGDKISMDLWGAYQAQVGERILVEPFSDVFNDTKTGFFQRCFRSLDKWLYRVSR